MAKQVTAGRDELSNFAPEFAHLNDDILFGEVWSREDKLSLRDRSLITVVALISSGAIDSSLKFHILNAKNNGVSKEEFAEAITHIAFYVGWPKAWAAFRMAKEIYEESDDIKHGGIFGLGEENKAYEKYFVGKSYLKLLSNPKDPIAISNVTFEPGCRNNWHKHNAKKGGGQVLICVDGYGYYQEKGKEAINLKPGDIVEIKPGVKHWHGARKDSWFSHLAFEIPGEETSTEWLEQVSDEEYSKLK